MINSISIYTINQYLRNPTKWILKKIYGIDEPRNQKTSSKANPHYQRGHEIQKYLNCSLDKSPWKENHQPNLEGEMKQMAELLRDKSNDIFNKIDGDLEVNKKIESPYFFLPATGETDFMIGNHIFELKTTNRHLDKLRPRSVQELLRQMMFYRGWYPGVQDFEMFRICAIYGYINYGGVPGVYYWISEDMKEYFNEGEYSIIKKDAVHYAAAEMTWALNTIENEMRLKNQKQSKSVRPLRHSDKKILFIPPSEQARLLVPLMEDTHVNR